MLRVDIWDLLKIVRRRWYVAVPVLLLGGILTFVVASGASTQYRSTAQTIVLGPNIQGEFDQTGEVVYTAANPYFDAGRTLTLARSVPLIFESPAIKAGLESEGLSSDYTMTHDNRQPLIMIKARADTPAQVEATIARLVELIQGTLDDTQQQFEVEEQIATLEVLSISQPAEDIGPVRLAYAGLGLFTIAAAVAAALATEVWADRRRRAGLDEDELLADVDAPPWRRRSAAQAEPEWADRLIELLETRLGPAALQPAESNGGRAPSVIDAKSVETADEEEDDDESEKQAPITSSRWGSRASA